MDDDKKEELKPLKPEHKIFVERYILDWNGSAAYKHAYPGVKDATARANASELLTKTNIIFYIEEVQKDLSKLAGVSALGIMIELKDIVFMELEENGEKYKAYGVKDRIKAIETINKMLGFNAPEKMDHTSKGQVITGPIIDFGNVDLRKPGEE